MINLKKCTANTILNYESLESFSLKFEKRPTTILPLLFITELKVLPSRRR